MRNKILLTVLLLAAALMITACAQAPSDGSTTPSSSLSGALEENTVFGDGSDTGNTQQSTSSTAPSTSVPGNSVPSTSVPGTSVPSTSAPGTSVPGTSVPGTSAPTTQPSTKPAGPDTSLTFEQFQAMTGAEQRAYQESFENLEDFFVWLNAAKEAYEKENPSIEIGGSGEVDMGDLVGGNG